MAEYTLTGFGFHAVTPGTSRLFIHVDVFPPGITTGNATPTNYYDIGLLRFGVDNWFGNAYAIDGQSIRIDIGEDVDTVGYSLFSGAQVTIGEDTPPVPPTTGSSVFPDT